MLLHHASTKFTGTLSIAFTSVLIGLGAPAYAADNAAANPQKPVAAAPTATAPASPGDKLDVSDLEKKYWAAKDSDFSVVQNRLYSKAGRFALTGGYGTLVNDPWTTASVYNGSLAYYFNEHWGLEAEYDHLNSHDNQAVSALNSQLGEPDHNQLKDFYGLQLDWVPFYAKMSVLNSAIIYFDLQLGVGLGMQSYSQQTDVGGNTQSTPAATLDITESFYLNRYLAVRVDLKNRWYSETTVKYHTPYASNGSDVANETILLGGLTVFLP